MTREELIEALLEMQLPAKYRPKGKLSPAREKALKKLRRKHTHHQAMDMVVGGHDFSHGDKAKDIAARMKRIKGK